ncbi:MAG: molybdopterin-dependent oxidoreductase, partial [Firmicutes bacterium]|nr:molybdopterin-dependent oxidoreductase [Bacillota bacterium]
VLDGPAQIVASGSFAPQESSRYAAVVPTAAWGEVDGTYINMEGRLQSAQAGISPPGQSRPIGSYLMGWSRSLRKPYEPVAWNPWDAAQDGRIVGDDVGAVYAINPDPPGEKDRAWLLIAGFSALEGGRPSVYYRQSEQGPCARIHPEAARNWGLPIDQPFTLQLSQGNRHMTVEGVCDERIPFGRIWVAFNHPQVAWAPERLSPGPVVIDPVAEKVVVS